MADLSTPGARPGHVLEARLPPGRTLVVLAGFVLIAVLLLSLVHPTSPSAGTAGSSGSAGSSATPPPATGSSTTTTTTAPTTTTTTTPPSSVTVVVANASNVNGVAAKATQELTPGGWKLLTPTNASTQVTTSAVYYAAGYEAQAKTVAATLHLPATVAAPLTSAVPVSGVSGAQVVVVVGTDLAGTLSGSTTTTTRPTTTTTTKPKTSAH